MVKYISTGFLAAFFFLVLGNVNLYAADGDTTVVTTWVQDEYTWPETHVQTFGGFPDASKRFRKVIMRYTLECASGGCDPWDVGAPVSVDHEMVNGDVVNLEIGRFITPYSREGVWHFDVTDYQTILLDSVTLRHSNASYTSGPQGYAVTIQFIFIEGTPPRYPFKVERLWQGGYRYGINTVDTTDLLQIDTLPNGDTAFAYNWDQFIVYDSVITFDSAMVGNGSGNAALIEASKADGRIQMLWLASELTTAGLTAGDISGLRLNVNTAGSPLHQCRLRLRHSNLGALQSNAYENDGFTDVYLQNTNLNSGWNSLDFTSPFNWNGTDNLILDLCFDNDAVGTDHQLISDNVGFNSVSRYNLEDYYMEFQDTTCISVPGTALSGLDSAVTISLWQKGDLNLQPKSDILFEALDSQGNRVMNVHLPWGNRRVYWDAGNDAGSHDRIDKAADPLDYQGVWVHWAFVKDVRTGEMKMYRNGQLWHSGTGNSRDLTGIAQMYIGSNGNGDNNFYEGKIDEFRVWAVALDSAAINDWMYRRLNANHPNYSDLRLYYDFNDGSGNSLTDQSASAQNGTVQGIPYWEGHGRVESCLQHPDQSLSMDRPQVIFEQGSYVSHLDSTLGDSVPILVINPFLTYNSFDSTVKALPVTIDAVADQTKLLMRTSGHGFGGNLNCAEFCKRWHSVTVDGNQVHQWEVWNDKCDLNPCFPQGGTWIYDRAGWCPGDFVQEEHLDFGNSLLAGQTYQIDYEVDPYTWNGSGSTPTWSLANHLISYEAPAFSLDAAIDEVISPSDKFEYSRMNPICGHPKVVLQNTGSGLLTSVDIHFGVNGGADSVYQWTGSLDFLEKEEVSLPVADWVSGADEFHVWVSQPNGSMDQYASNDTFYTHFTLSPSLPNHILLNWRTNNAGLETRYSLMDEDGNVLFQNSPFIGPNMTNRDTFLLQKGCYIFRLYDLGQDGLDFFANNDGTGYAQLEEVGGGLLEGFNPNFGGEIRFHFTVDQNVNLVSPSQPEILLYPNPSQGKFNLEVELSTQETIELEVLTLMGQQIYSRNLGLNDHHFSVLDLSNESAGIYLLKIHTQNGVFTRKIEIIRD